MAPLPIPAATFRLALASSGITITDTAATRMPGRLRSRDFAVEQSSGGFVGDVCRQREEAPADELQRGPLYLFTPGWVRIVMQAPEQRRPGSHFDDAVQSEAD